MLTTHRRYTYPPAMEQVRTGEQTPPSGGGAMSKAASAKDRVDDALRRLEAMLDERLQAEAGRADDLAKRLDRLERQHDELKKVALEVEGRLERAMEYIRSLLAADQK
jgi:exonuclease VII large subunit